MVRRSAQRMILASIDIGTNSTLLLIARYDNSGLTPVRNEVEITRLGQGVGKTGRLNPEAVERTFQTLEKYRQIIDRYEVQSVIIGGTSAMRDAQNGAEFIDRVKSELGWDIRILTGNDEAKLTFLATQKEFSDLDNELLVVDIGGGSTEFIAGNRTDLQFMKSLDVGTVRFTEQYIENDPPNSDEIRKAREAIRHHLKSDLQELQIESENSALIGVAGTVTTLLAVEKEMSEYIPEEIHRQPITRKQIDDLLKKFCSIPFEERQHLPGLQPKRADVIIMGTIILQEIMDQFGYDRLLINDRGVRYGLIYKYLEKRGIS